MSVARELFHLQEIELAIEANEQAQSRLGRQLADHSLVAHARARLTAERQRLEETAKTQKTLDFDIDDLSAKIKTIDRKLYDGKTVNPKELSSLQAEGGDFQKKRSLLEDKALILMEESEAIKQNILTATHELTIAEAEQETRHKNLNAELTQLQTDHAALEIKRQTLISQIEPTALAVYKDLKKRKGTAVAKVEQGTCHGCRIAVSNAELQQTKGNAIVRCGNCGRILYLP
ncbi:MAG: hypothetical protein PHE50_06240 [Dehalococcoidales bacterium]|nr:hypothetical protein [Dehalococcoidales bacterium]